MTIISKDRSGHRGNQENEITDNILIAYLSLPTFPLVPPLPKLFSDSLRGKEILQTNQHAIKMYEDFDLLKGGWLPGASIDVVLVSTVGL